jgi:hypothetical protein
VRLLEGQGLLFRSFAPQQDLQIKGLKSNLLHDALSITINGAWDHRTAMSQLQVNMPGTP